MSLFYFLLQLVFVVVVGGATVFMALLGAFWVIEWWADR